MAPQRIVQIPVASLAEPALAARTGMDEDGLVSLAQSIRELGLIEPLIVKPADDGLYEIIAGHRRFKALQLLNAPHADCIVRKDLDSHEAVKVHENIEREELSPVDEAQYYGRLFEQLGRDTENVASKVKRRRDHVEDRLLLLAGDADVLAALRDGKITLAVAREMNKITDK